jgi:hypothetical protein
LESRALLSTLFPGNPFSAGTPQLFSGVGGTNSSGGALTAEQSFEAAIGGSKNAAPAPQSTGFRTITWDAVKLDGTDFGGGANTIVIDKNHTVGIPLNRFQAQGVFFGDIYAVSGDGFASVNPNVAGLFPAFSPKNTFAMFNDNTIEFEFVLPSPGTTTPALAAARGFGAIFINNEVASTSSIELFHGDQSLGTFVVPVGTQGQAEFLGVLFNNPIVTRATLTLGTDTLFSFNGTTFSSSSSDNPPSHNLVVTDDFVYPEPVSSVDGVPILPGPTGTLNAQPKASAMVGAAFSGVVATFSDTDSATASQFTATINWGDGHISDGTVQANALGGFDVVGTNTFRSAGLIPTGVQIKDFGGAPDLSVAEVIQVVAANTNTALAVAPSTGIAGQPVTLTAQVSTGTGGAVTDGFVLFQDNGAPIGIGAVNSSGAASFTTTHLPLGSQSLSVEFLGTRDFTSSTSAAVPEYVTADVTSQFAITLGSIRHRGKRFYQHVTLTNNGAALLGPLDFVLDHLGKNVKLLNASAVTASAPPLGSPFIVVNLGYSSQIGTGQSVGVDLVFSARSMRSLIYTPRLLAGLVAP